MSGKVLFPGSWQGITENVGEVVTNTTQLAPRPAAASSSEFTLFVEARHLSTAWVKRRLWVTWTFTACGSSRGRAGAAWSYLNLHFHLCATAIYKRYAETEPSAANTPGVQESLDDISHSDSGGKSHHIWCWRNQVSDLITKDWKALSRLQWVLQKTGWLPSTKNWKATRILFSVRGYIHVLNKI